MKTKFLFPAVAIIFATGMSFTTVELGEKQTLDYYRENSQWMSIPEINCGDLGPNNCEIRKSDGSIHKVYDIQDFDSLKKTISEDPFEL